MSYLLLTSDPSAAVGGFGMILWLVIIFAMMYFMMLRPQKKQQKEKEAMLSELAVGDTVLTTSGFYGVIIDIAGDTVIVEFGSNRNCRIPMQKGSIAQCEKPEAAKKAEEPAKTEKEK